MNDEIRAKIEEFKEMLKVSMPNTTTSVNIYFSSHQTKITIGDRTAKELKNDGIAMQNIQGDFIK